MNNNKKKPYQTSASVNAGLPPLELGEKPWSYFEFWPTAVFYFPVVIYWLWLGLRYRSLGLPLIANPNIPLGGMVGESKSDILLSAGSQANKYILPFTIHVREAEAAASMQAKAALAVAEENGLGLPLVVKPDLGCRGRAVRVVEDESDLAAYIEEFPAERKYLLQKLSPWKAEAGIFYVRLPGESAGRITSITLKYVPTVVGDGRSSIKQLLNRHPRTRKLRRLYLKKLDEKANLVPEEGEEIALTFSGSHCRGSIFRDGNKYFSKEMEGVIDNVLCDLPDFHYGRLDIKFEDIASLQAGRNFCIIEVNGASSEATHIWDSRGSLSAVFKTLLGQYRTLFKIGDRLRSAGCKPASSLNLIREWLKELKSSSSYPEGH